MWNVVETRREHALSVSCVSELTLFFVLAVAVAPAPSGEVQERNDKPSLALGLTCGRVLKYSLAYICNRLPPKACSLAVRVSLKHCYNRSWSSRVLLHRQMLERGR